MYNLPTDATINECVVFHEGNHDDRGNPHEQYISKFKTYSVKVADTGKNNYFKIANITHTPNSNVSLDYNIKIIDIPRSGDDILNKTHNIRINITNTTIKICHIGANRFDLFANSTTLSNGDVSYDIYLKPYLDWQVFYYNLDFARGSSYPNYTEEYAFRHITLYSSNYVASIGTAIGTIVKDRPWIQTTATTTGATVTSYGGQSYSITITGITPTCIFTVNPTTSIPGEFIHSSYVTSNNTVTVNFKNISTYSKALPDTTWNISYKPIS